MTHAKPRIAVLLDENTSGDASRYEAAKGYFTGVAQAGGLPFGIPYRPEIVGAVLDGFDGLLTVGGRFAYPDAWYVGEAVSKAPASDRLAIEQALVEGFLARRKPILGICAGMQLLACLHGCKLTPDLRAERPQALDHDGRGIRHSVSVVPGTMLVGILGQGPIAVNSFHREAVVSVSDHVRVSALAPDGVIEAIEIPAHPFALGLQWHQELLIGDDHPGNAIFCHFVEASGRSGVSRFEI